jgi:hypothetical protein
MMALQFQRLVREGIPIAAVLLFWNLLAVVSQTQHVGESVGSAGVVMAALYVAVRGVSLSDEVLPPMTGDVESILYENASLAVPAGAWFLAAMAVGAVESHIHEFTSILSSVRSALAGAGLGVVALYAVAAGYRALGDENAGVGGAEASDEPATSDGTDSSSADD